MAVHFLTILLQTGEFVRQHELRNVSSSFFILPTTTHRSTVSSLSTAEGENDKYELIRDDDRLGMSDYKNSNQFDNRSSSSIPADTADAADWLVFLTLETLGVSGWVGNLTLLLVIISSGLLERPSFIFIASLAVADVFHSTVTSCYFYPPIILRKNVFNRIGVQFMNALDWTAWGVTLTHMIAICVDRLFAIVLFQDYARLVTVKRAILISSLCWFSFAGVNILFASLNFCCIVVPQPEFYTFGYEDTSGGLSPNGDLRSESTNVSVNTTNAYKPLYVPLECLAMLIVAVGNPIILLNLYEKYRRKRTMRAASVILMEVGQSLCRQPMSMDASLARDIKIFLQIIVVTVIFFAYMFIYYLFFYITEFSDKWSTMLNSICYSITHMINPVVYFSLNEQMQKQFKTIVNNMGLMKRRKMAKVGRRNALCGVASIVHAISIATTAVSETSPLMRLSSGDQEDSVGGGQQQSIHEAVVVSETEPPIKQKVTFENLDNDNDENFSASTPLLLDGYKIPSNIYDLQLIEPCEDDAFV